MEKTESTPYDDVFRTLLNDCPGLILPVINEIFTERYAGDEKLYFLPNEHYLNSQDGREEKRVTDTCFVVTSEQTKKYYIECQSRPDHSMLVRIFEYASQIALDGGVLEEGILEVEFPVPAVLFLRHNRRTPESMLVRIRTPEGELSYRVAVMKLQNYTLEEIFGKDLLFLLPFYIFTHESRFAEYAEDEEKLESLRQEYAYIRKRLEELCAQGRLDEYTKCTIVDMTDKVVRNLASGYEKVREGVKDVMGGRILEYEAKRIREEGLEQGLERGLEQGLERGLEQGLEKGRHEILMELVYDGILTMEEAAERMGKNRERKE